MSQPIDPRTGLPWTEDEAGGAHQLMVKLMRRAGQKEEAERLEYSSNASMEEHARVLEELCDLSDAIIASRGKPPEKPPLPNLRAILEGKKRDHA